jgi:hypothetical protein
MPDPKRYRPAEGRRVLKPGGAPLADAGEPIALTPYWRRLLAAGDIEPVPSSKPTSRTRAKPASAEGSKSA